MDASVLILLLALISGVIGVFISWITLNRKQKKEAGQEGEIEADTFVDGTGTIIAQLNQNLINYKLSNSIPICRS